MIDVVSIVITRTGVEIVAIGSDGRVTERYAADEKGILQCIKGNFEDEQIFGDNDGLVNSLCSIYDQSAEIWRELNKQP